MREIKFRAWYKDKFHHNIEKHHVEHHSMSGFSGEVWDFSDWLKYAIVQQYTGLKDKNGKEIYEGDILDFNRLNYSVYWRDYEWVATCPYYHKYHWPTITPFRNVESGEIIGNIFENPELLKFFYEGRH